jgi:hypothetical protein
LMKSIRNLLRQDREKYVIPRRVQDVIPIQKIWEDGIFLTGGRYAKTFRFTDINYQVASEPDKEKMFRGYSALINSLDCGATTKITIFNHKMSQINFEKSILMPMQWDGLDDYREEYNQMLLDKATNGNGIVQEKFLTVSVRKKDVDAARSFFARVEADLSSHFAALGSTCGPMNAMERLQILHRFYRRGEENEFRLQKYGEYSRANAVEFSMKMAEQMGWNSYGDKQYVPRVLRYYPIGKVFYIPEDGDAIVDVALTQIGNVGGEPYWIWYGFTSRVEWCACFVSWCADQCGYLDSGAFPKFSGCVFGMQWFQQRGLWLDGSAEPMPGMLIFFDWATQDGVPDHVGIVERVENNVVYTVEGNSRDMCRQNQYSLGSSVILGYGAPASV